VLRRVLAAVDPGAQGSVERRLATRVLRFVVALAGGAPLEIHVAHAFANPTRSTLATSGARLALATGTPRAEAAAERVEDLLAEVGLRGSAVVHLSVGSAEEVIPSLVHRIDADVVALGTTGAGRAGPSYESTAEAIVARLGRSAVVVKAEGVARPVHPIPDGAGSARAA
jgi:nucleotide-binding universal stress UspA family protein